VKAAAVTAVVVVKAAAMTVTFAAPTVALLDQEQNINF
jgi:hypothetical protein